VGAGDLAPSAREVMVAFVSRVCLLGESDAAGVVNSTFDGSNDDGCRGFKGGARGVLGGFPPSDETPPHWYLGGYANFLLADPAS
jgi:hypothetical protein